MTSSSDIPEKSGNPEKPENPISPGKAQKTARVKKPDSVVASGASLPGAFVLPGSCSKPRACSARPMTNADRYHYATWYIMPRPAQRRSKAGAARRAMRIFPTASSESRKAGHWRLKRTFHLESPVREPCASLPRSPASHIGDDAYAVNREPSFFPERNRRQAASICACASRFGAQTTVSHSDNNFPLRRTTITSTV